MPVTGAVSDTGPTAAYAAKANFSSAFIFRFRILAQVRRSADGFQNFNIPVETSTSPYVANQPNVQTKFQ